MIDVFQFVPSMEVNTTVTVIGDDQGGVSVDALQVNRVNVCTSTGEEYQMESRIFNMLIAEHQLPIRLDVTMQDNCIVHFTVSND